VFVRIECEHRIPLRAEDFWEMIHAPEYEAAVAEEMGLAEYRELERWEDDEAIHRRIRVTPRAGALPAALQKLLRRMSAVGAVEEQRRSKARREVFWRVTPGVLSDRIELSGVVRVEPVDDGSCLRKLEGEVRVKIPGAGLWVERGLVSSIVSNYARSAEIAARMRRDDPQGDRR
jgi:hypothetical protein